MVTIYGLICPHSGEIRYIGKTAQKLHRRLNAHLNDALRNQRSHKQRWIKKCLDDGAAPSLCILEIVSANERWQDRERAWIQSALDTGLDLTNQTAGGEGLDYIDQLAKLRYSQVQAALSKKRYAENPEIRKAMIDGNKASWAANRESRINALMSGWTETSKQKHADAMARVIQTPEFRAAKSRGSKKAWANHRHTIMQAFSRPETKAKQSERKRSSWTDPATRIRMMNRWTPEARALQAQRIRERQAFIQSRMTPEVRAKQAATLKETWAKRKADK